MKTIGNSEIADGCLRGSPHQPGVASGYITQVGSGMWQLITAAKHLPVLKPEDQEGGLGTVYI